jgi:WD40 repeat protein
MDEARPAHIDFRHYDAMGGVREGIDKHGEEIYGDLSPQDRAVAEAIFRCLTERDPVNNDVRRPTEVGVIAEIASVAPTTVVAVADVFRTNDVAFLTPPVSVPLNEGVIVDITHESLIRKWRRLGSLHDPKGWVQQEAELREQYHELVIRARRAEAGDVLIGTELQRARAWRDRGLKRQWALRNEPDPGAFDLVAGYIERSDANRRRRERWRRVGFIAGATLFVLIVALVVALLQGKTANVQLRQLRDLATARQLASQADTLRDRDSQVEVRTLLATESLRQSPLIEGIVAIREPLALLVTPAWTKPRPSSAAAPTDSEDDIDAPGALRFSPDGRHLAVLSRAGNLKVYDASTGADVRLPALDGRVGSMAWSGEWLYVATVVQHKSTPLARVTSTRPGTDEARVVLTTPCESSCFLAPDAAYLVVNLDAPADTGAPVTSLWPVTARTKIDLKSPSGPVRALGPAARLLVSEPEKRGRGEALALIDRGAGPLPGIAIDSRLVIDLTSPSGLLALRDRRQNIRVYRTGSLTEEVGQVRSDSEPVQVALSADGQQVAIGDDEGGVRVVDWKTNAKRAVWAHRARVDAITFSPDGTLVSSLDETGDLRTTRLPTMATLVAPTATRPPLAAFDVFDRYLYVRRVPSGAQQLFDASTLSEIRIGRSSDPPLIIGLSPDGRFAAAVRKSATIEVLELATGAVRSLTFPSRPTSIAVGPGGQYVAPRIKGRLSIVDVKSGQAVPLPEEVVKATAAVFSPDGRFLALRRQSELWLLRGGSWEVEPASRAWKMGGIITSVVFSPDGKLMAARTLAPLAGEADGDIEDVSGKTFLLIDTGTLREMDHRLPKDARIGTLRFSPDSRWLTVVTSRPQRAAHVFALPAATRETLLLLDFNASSLAFSRSGLLLAIGAVNAAPRVHRLPDGVEVSRMALRAGERLLATRFSDDERRLTMVSRSDSDVSGVALSTYSLFPDDLIREACARVSRNLSDKQEWRKYLTGLPYRRTCENLPPAD